MKEYVRALLLHPYETPAAALIDALEKQCIGAERAYTCAQAAARLSSTNPPHLVFTDTELPDGTWSDVLNLADRAQQPVNVIVVSPTADVSLYLDVMEQRAFDFITHSFTAPELTHILRCAVDNVLTRRRTQRPVALMTRALSTAGHGRKEDFIGL